MFTSGGQAAPSKYCRRQGSASQIGMRAQFDCLTTQASSTLEGQSMDRKILTRVGPNSDGSPARAARQCHEVLERVFIAVLGMDGLFGGEIECAPGGSDVLAHLADEVHLDPVVLGIVEGAMVEGLEIEISVELAIDARQQVEIELCSEAGLVIVSGVKDAHLLHQIDSNDQGSVSSQHPPGVAQECAGFVRLEIADGRSGKEPGMRHACRRGWQ